MILAFLLRLITGAQARWIGCEPLDRQRIYFANHSSNLDGPVIWASLHPLIRRRVRLVAARDYWTGDPIRNYIATKVFNALLINRLKVTREDNPIVDMQQALDAGSSLIIFPEGRRQTDEDADMNEFKAGLYRLATSHPQVELIPVYLRNLNRILPKGEYLPLPVMASISFGEPLHLREGETRDDFLGRSREAVTRLREQEDQ